MAAESEEKSLNCENMNSVFDPNVRMEIIRRNFYEYFHLYNFRGQFMPESKKKSTLWREILLRTEEPTECIHSTQCLMALRNGDVALLRVVLDYRVNIYILLREFVERSNSNTQSLLEFYQTRRLIAHQIYGNLGSWNEHIKSYFSSTRFEGKVQVQLENFISISPRRLVYVLWALEVASKYWSSSPKERTVRCFRCFRMMFNFIREPYVTLLEMEKLLRYILEDQKGTDEFVYILHKRYKEEFPACARPYQPRTLQHLCRCQVRQDVRNAGRSPQELREVAIKTESSGTVHLPEYIINDILSEEYFSDAEVNGRYVPFSYQKYYFKPE